MDRKLQNNIFSKLNQIEEKLGKLERRLEGMEENTQEAFRVLQSHLVRVKNGEKLSDDFVLNRKPYNDLSPEKAIRLYQDKDKDFILIDVSDKSYSPSTELPEAIKIPLEELAARHTEITSKAASVFIISEDGTKSILACEILNRRGYFNINNISGGYKFWPAARGFSPRETRGDLYSA